MDVFFFREAINEMALAAPEEYQHHYNATKVALDEMRSQLGRSSLWDGSR